MSARDTLVVGAAWVLALVSAGTVAEDARFGPADPVAKDPGQLDPKRPVERELEASVPDGFSAVAFRNLETTNFDPRSFDGAPYAWDGDWTNASVPAVADETAAREVIDQMVKQAAGYGLPALNVSYSGTRGIDIP